MTLLKNGPVERRKFLDIMISQLKTNYVFVLNQYMKTLEQRNTYLRQIKFEKKTANMLDIWDEKLTEYGFKVCIYRNEFMEKIKERINKFHMAMTEEKEKISIEYKSSLKNKEQYLEMLKNNRNIEIQKGYTISRNSQR